MPCPRVTSFVFALSAACGILAALPAIAADGQIVITDAKAQAGNVTPGDSSGYPVTLTLRGSYILGSNLNPGAGKDGIVAAAPDIAIDLNGFTMSGGASGGGVSTNARRGIWGQADRLTVKNGTIGAFTEAGIYALSRPFLIVENMRIINGNFGINSSGGFARIHNSTIASNRGYGIACGDFCEIQESIAAGNLQAGVYCALSCHVEGNIISKNNSDGIFIKTGTVLGNTIFSNGDFGIQATGTVGFGNNTIVGNVSGPIFGGAFVTLHPNACSPAC